MLNRILLLVFSISIVYSLNAAAESTSSVWQIGDDAKDTLTLVDDEKTRGEELLVLNIAQKTKTIKVEDVSVDSYGGSYFVADKDGAALEDLSIEVVFKSRFEQIAQLLQDEKFRAAFTEIPESCPEGANGFLILSDNIAGESYGYCLSPN